MTDAKFDPDEPDALARLVDDILKRAVVMHRGLEAVRDSTTPHADELRDLAFEALRDAA